MFLRQLILSVCGKVFKNYSKTHLESTKFENQCIKKRMFKPSFYILQFLLKIRSCEKSVKDKSSGE